jgi:hypothetical protein
MTKIHSIPLYYNINSKNKVYDMTDVVIQENKECNSDSDKSKQSNSDSNKYSDSDKSKQSNSDSNKSNQTKIINISYDEHIPEHIPEHIHEHENINNIYNTSESNSHLEVFSNDTENKNNLNSLSNSSNVNELTNSSNVNELTNKATSETINKSLARLKLPELQDKAIELKIQLSVNGKKKTRTELINEIKTHSELNENKI